MRPAKQGAQKKYYFGGLNQQEAQELKTTFDLFDSQKKGVISTKELEQVMEALGYSQKNPLIFQRLKKLRQQELDFQDFINFMTEFDDFQSRQGIMNIFDLFDYDKTGKISVENLKEMGKELGENFTDQEYKKMIEISSYFDALNREEFYCLVGKKVLH